MDKNYEALLVQGHDTDGIRRILRAFVPQVCVECLHWAPMTDMATRDGGKWELKCPECGGAVRRIDKGEVGRIIYEQACACQERLEKLSRDLKEVA